MTHSLVEIPREDWHQLRDLYKEHRKEASAYGMLQTIIKWIEKEPVIDIKLYALDGDWKKDGTFLFIDTAFAFTLIMLNTLNNMERLTAMLNCLDNKSKCLLYGYPERLQPAVKAHWTQVGNEEEKFIAHPGAWYHIERQKALEFEIVIPEHHKFSSLTEQHAEQVNSVWPHQFPGSVEFVKRLIRLNDSAGLFDNEGNLIAWCLRLPLGSLGLLQVDDNHKRKGLGSLVVRYISKLIAEKNEEVTSPVVVTNTASRTMFEKLGFSVIDHAYWMFEAQNLQ